MGWQGRLLLRPSRQAPASVLPGRLPCGRSEHGSAGMSGPGSDVSGELSDYLEQKGINVLFLELVEYMLADKPANPVQYILTHLVSHYPDMCQIPRVIGFETEEVTDEKVELEEEDDEEERRDKPLHRRSKHRRGSVSAASIEPADIDKHYRRRRVPKSKEDMAELMTILRTLSVFETMREERLEKVAMAMTPSMPENGKVIYTQDQWDSNAMYVVVGGQVNLYQKKAGRGIETVMPYRRGQYFGAHQIMYPCKREHTAKAATDDVKLWVLDRSTLKLTVMEDVIETRARRVEYLLNVPVLATLEDLERQALADALEVHDYSEGDVIIRQNDPARRMFIVESGRVAVTQQVTPVSEPTEICRLGPGAYFGEMALLTDRPRTASVTAVTGARLLVINRTTLRRLFGPFSAVLLRDKGLYNTFMAQKI